MINQTKNTSTHHAYPALRTPENIKKSITPQANMATPFQYDLPDSDKNSVDFLDNKKEKSSINDINPTSASIILTQDQLEALYSNSNSSLFCEF